jgi:hypothetical protein
VSVPIDPRLFGSRREREERLLSLARDAAGQLNAPDVIETVRIVTQLRQGNAELGRPPFAVDGGCPVPDGVPGVVEIAVPAHRGVAPRAGRAQPKDKTGQVIVVGVEVQLEDVALDGLVAPRELRLDLVRFAVEEPHPDIQRVIVDQDAGLGALGYRSALLRVELPEIAERESRLPGRIIQTTVDAYRAGLACRANGRSRFVSGRPGDDCRAVRVGRLGSHVRRKRCEYDGDERSPRDLSNTHSKCHRLRGCVR